MNKPIAFLPFALPSFRLCLSSLLSSLAHIRLGLRERVPPFPRVKLLLYLPATIGPFPSMLVHVGL